MYVCYVMLECYAMHAFMNVCTYACKYGYNVCMCLWALCMYVCLYALYCMCVMYVCMYLCYVMYAGMYVYVMCVRAYVCMYVMICVLCGVV